MADLKELITKVTVDEATTQFAKHFQTKSSVKNLLRKVGNAKLLAPIVEDEETGTCVLSDDATQAAIITAIMDGFDMYTAQKAAWDNAGEKHPLPERVEFFRDAVMTEMDKADEVRTLINNGISVAKANAHVVSDYLSAQEDGDDVRKAILASVIRAVMNMAVATDNASSDTARDVSTGETVEAEVITPDTSAAGHTSESKPNSGASTESNKPADEETVVDDNNTKDGVDAKKEITKKKSDVEKLLKQVRDLLKKDYSDVTDAEHVRAGILKSAKSIATEATEFSVEGSLTGSAVDWATNILESMLPDQYVDKLGAIPVSEAVKLGARAVVGAIIERCGDVPLCDAKQDDISVAVMMGSFLMYSVLAAELPEYENIDYVLMPVLTAAMADYVSKNENVTAKTWATLVNLSGIRKFSEYKDAVNGAIACKDERDAAVSALSRFGHSLVASDAEKHIKRGIELYMSLAA